MAKTKTAGNKSSRSRVQRLVRSHPLSNLVRLVEASDQVHRVRRLAMRRALDDSFRELFARSQCPRHDTNKNGSKSARSPAKLDLLQAGRSRHAGRQSQRRAARQSAAVKAK